ncbi:hypothetical protein Syun_007330 [Stephania yunnanensis]|uniref:Uncharacterized protein n=1 Tax=Stephania yunnanensis TaxID=152371 RepID=A0AAP0Q070_9MAGN
MALVDLLSADFMGPKLQGSIKLQINAYIAILLGAGGMSLMAKWVPNDLPSHKEGMHVALPKATDAPFVVDISKRDGTT